MILSYPLLEDPEVEVHPPSFLVDSSRKPAIMFDRGPTIGKGGFARVYQITNRTSDQGFALKAIDKNKYITKKGVNMKNFKEKVMREVTIHSMMYDVNVIKFYHHFEDPQFFYLILELAPQQTLLEVSKARGVLTEPEVRYYFLQISAGARYIHQQKVLHRDLKLANMFLSGKDCVFFSIF